MGILERISTILRANINANLDRAANPEVALNQMLSEMEVAIQEARTHLLELQNIERQLEAEKTKYLRESREWGTRAERAVAVYREDAAREALQRRSQAENAAAQYHKQWEEHHIVVVQFQDQLKNLVQRYQDTKRNRSLMLTRQRAAITQQRMQQVMQNAQQLDPASPAGQLDREVRRLEAQAQAQAEVNRIPRTLEEELAQLDAETNSNRQLNSLQQRYHEPPAQGWSHQPVIPPAGKSPPQLQPQPRELWFENTPPPTPPKPQELWFDDSVPATPSKPQELWFDDDSAPSQTVAPANQTKELWFDNAAPDSSDGQTQPTQSYWFGDSVADSTEGQSQPTQAKDYWFDDTPTTAETPVAEQNSAQPQNYWFDDDNDKTPIQSGTVWPAPPDQLKTKQEVWFSEEAANNQNISQKPADKPEKPEQPAKKDYWFDD